MLRISSITHSLQTVRASSFRNGRFSRFARSSVELLVALSCAGSLAFAAAAPAPAAPPDEPSKYTGPGSCSIHELPRERQAARRRRIAQNEYSIWVVQDKHAKAYMALTTPVGERIGRNLGIGKSEEARQMPGLPCPRRRRLSSAPRRLS